MHDEDQGTLQAVEDGEDVCDRRRALAEQEGSKRPHQSQYAHLGDGGDCESSAGRNDKSDKNATTKTFSVSLVKTSHNPYGSRMQSVVK